MKYLGELEYVELYEGDTKDQAYHLIGDPGEVGLRAPRGSVTDIEADILREMATDKQVLEIGTGTGYSSYRMLESCSSLTTIDIDPWVIENVFPELEKLGARCLEQPPEGEMFDLVFIDGSHDRSAVVADYHMAESCTEPGAKIVFHDMQIYGVREACEELGISPRKLGTKLGMAVLDR